MQTAIRQRLGLASLAMVAILAVLTILPMQAIAIPQDNPSYPTACAGVWHWVHNQTVATEGTLTAIFMIDETKKTIVIKNGAPYESTNLHYEIVLGAEATLLSASDTVEDGLLLLSHWPTCPGDTAPDVTPPDVSLPGDSVPDVSLPGDSVPDVSLPGDSVPDVSSPGDSVPDVSSPGDTASDVTSPEVSPQDAAPAGDASSDVTDTTRLEVFGTTITAAEATAEVTSETLPFTGIGLEATGGIALSLVAMGGLVLLSFGHRPGTGRTYEGRHRRPARPLFRPAK